MLTYDARHFLMHSKTLKQLAGIADRLRLRAQVEWVLMVIGLGFTVFLAATWVIHQGPIRSDPSSLWLERASGAGAMIAIAMSFVSAKKLLSLKCSIKLLKQQPARYAFRKQLAGVMSTASASPSRTLFKQMHGCVRCQPSESCRQVLRKLYELRNRHAQAATQSLSELTDAYLDALEKARLIEDMLIGGDHGPDEVAVAHTNLHKLATHVNRVIKQAPKLQTTSAKAVTQPNVGVS